MKTSDLIFIGIKGSVIALRRDTGVQVWATHLKGYSFVNVVVQNDVILASSQGEIFCLDALTGNGLWSNPLTGYGMGLATIATGLTSGTSPAMAEQLRQEEESAVAASTTAAAASAA